MNFSCLEEARKDWSNILVIGRTIERGEENCHILGMTLGGEAKLYIIEPYHERRNSANSRKGIRTQRRILKENEESEESYLHCSDISLGKRKLRVQGGQGEALGFAVQDYRTIQLFLDMMNAGWIVPEWLKEEEWDNLMLLTLKLADVKRLPSYSPEMPITIRHRPNPVRHILEKTVTLRVGESRSVAFVDHTGEKVQCHINNVTLIDVWKDIEEQFRDPRYTEKVSPEQLQQAKEGCYRALEQSCPEGACYIGIEYECSKELNLQFYSKEYLKSCPQKHAGSASFLMMRLKPDKKTGTHGLPLQGAVIQTPVAPDTSKIPAELFLYFEKMKEWEETV